MKAGGHGLLPAELPLLGKVLQVRDLPAAFPIHINGAQRFGAKDSRFERTARVGKEKNGVAGSGGPRPFGELRQLWRVKPRIVHDAAKQRDGEERRQRYSRGELRNSRGY